MRVKYRADGTPYPNPFAPRTKYRSDGTPYYNAFSQAKTNSYDLTSANATMTLLDTLNDIIQITGSISTNRTVTLFRDSLGNGAKKYTVIMTPQASSGGPFTVTFTTGVAGKQTVAVPVNLATDTLTSGILQFDIFVDSVGNVSSSFWTVAGSNSNGSWIKFADGTMEIRVNVATPTFTALAQAVTVNFPVAFIDTAYTPNAVLDHEWSGVAYLFINFAKSVTTSSSNVVMSMVSYPGGTVSANIIYFTAVGRWK